MTVDELRKSVRNTWKVEIDSSSFSVEDKRTLNESVVELNCILKTFSENVSEGSFARASSLWVHAEFRCKRMLLESYKEKVKRNRLLLTLAELKSDFECRVKEFRRASLRDDVASADVLSDSVEIGDPGPNFSVRNQAESSRPSYGDDAIRYVQLKREGKICSVKFKVCLEHKVHAKLYGVTLTVDEDEEKVTSVQCHDCIATQVGCKHSIALLMWIHRRSEEPSCTEVQYYWLKSKLSRIGTTLKFITAKDFASMHLLVLKYREKSCDIFIDIINNLTDEIINKIENETRDQYRNSFWYELRYGRITAFRTYEVSRCQKDDGIPISLIIGGKIPDTPAMKRGRSLEDEVWKTVGIKLGKKLRIVH
ncbi:hypothetical protein FQA39_LY13426 [Lamprigera yunnana]|nr:hypothetical protein FQA39_LY13426 [Lamprigera yunnana]